MSFNNRNSCPSSSLTRSASSLRRTGSYLCLSELQGPTHQQFASPYGRVPAHHFVKNQEKRFYLSYDEARDRSPSRTPTRPTVGERTSSPLSPVPQTLPPRPAFPRSKVEPDLYKVAIRTRMQYSDEGQKILQMGSHLAVQIMNATRELEGIVAARHRDLDGDIAMGDAQPSSSWLVVSSDDWEMDDC